jgi:AcrR family transcriptional regulator
MNGTSPSTQAEFANETHRRLLDCALTLFATQGYAATSVREIIEAAGVTRPVLYYYCENKEDLFKRVVHWTHNDAYEELERRLAETSGTVDRLRTIIRETFSFCAADPRIPQLMFQTTYAPAVSGLTEFLLEIAERRFSIVAQVMQEGIVAGELHAGDTASLSLVFCSIMDHHVNTFCRLPHPEKNLTAERAHAIVDVFFYGVGTGRRRTPQLPPLSVDGGSSVPSTDR